MQQKHAWERLVQLSGDQSEDFKKVLDFLEKHDIRLGELSRNPIKVADGVYIKEYRKIIGKEVVVTIWEEDNNSGIFLLKNAWVKTQ